MVNTIDIIIIIIIIILLASLVCWRTFSPRQEILMRLFLGICLGFLLATALPAVSSASGYTYNPQEGSVQVVLDQFMPECKGVKAVLVVSADRQEADLQCVGIGAALPVFQGPKRFILAWDISR